MMHPPLHLGILLITLGLTAGVAKADTLLTFDDINVANEQPLSQGYGGLTWNNVQLMNTTWFLSDSGPSGYGNGTVSGSNVAWVWGPDVNSGLATASVSSPDPFVFESVALTAAWNDNLNIEVSGYLKGELVDSQTVVVNPTGPTELTLKNPLIDTLTFTASGGTVDPSFGVPSSSNFVMDNFEFLPVINAPEPSTLVIGGLICLGFTWHRRRGTKTAA